MLHDEFASSFDSGSNLPAIEEEYKPGKNNPTRRDPILAMMHSSRTSTPSSLISEQLCNAKMAFSDVHERGASC